MSDLETPRTHSLMDRYYEEEREQREREMSLAELSLKLDANDLAFLSMIARRFRKGREDVAQEVLSSALLDLFARIEPGERKLMARDADESAKNNAESIAEENGVRDVEFRSGYWAQQERQITKLEKQREKAEKEAEKIRSKKQRFHQQSPLRHLNPKPALKNTKKKPHTTPRPVPLKKPRRH